VRLHKIIPGQQKFATHEKSRLYSAPWTKVKNCQRPVMVFKIVLLCSHTPYHGDGPSRLVGSFRIIKRLMKDSIDLNLTMTIKRCVHWCLLVW